MTSLLADTRARLLALVERVPPQLRDRRPAPHRWSVAEILEHLARADSGVARLFTTRGAAAPAEPSPDLERAQYTSAHVARVLDRNLRIEAPERIRPTEGITWQEALKQLHAARVQLEGAIVAAHPEALDRVTHVHPVIGPLVLRGWIDFTAHHEARHTAQIAEIAEQLQA
jgi:hypothetical protein